MAPKSCWPCECRFWTEGSKTNEYLQRLANQHSDLSREITFHTSKPRIEASFSLSSTLLDDLERLAHGWPWRAAVQAAAGYSDHIVEQSVYSLDASVQPVQSSSHKQHDLESPCYILNQKSHVPICFSMPARYRRCRHA